MRYFCLFVLPLALSAQSAESEQRVTQALISEIQQLRLAIERSTLLNARTQLAISQFQMQETSVARLTTQLNEVKMQGTGMSGHKIRLAEQIKDMETTRTTAEPAVAKKLDVQIRDAKLELEQAMLLETNRSAREGELTSQLQAVQNQIAASRARIDEMERALDTAIQQLLKK